MVKSVLARIDFFRKVPEELQVSSGSGLLFTVCSVLAMLLLVVSHYRAYLEESTRTYVVLDSHQEDQLRISFNVSLVAVPCHHASVDFSDHMGQRFTNITRHVRHFRLAASKDTNELERLDEIVIEDKPEGIASWGAVDRSTHDGVHYSTPLTTKNFFEFMAKYELVLVNYYAPWCPFCQQLNPEWERAAAQLQDHPEYAERVVMASVDCTDEDAVYLCRRAHIRAFPSMLIYMYGSTYTRFIYNGPRKTEYLLQFLDLFYRRLEPEADFAEEVHVNDNNLALPMHVNHDNLDAVNLKKVKRTMPTGAIEGCEISGSVSVNRVPGKLVFTARSPDHSFDLAGVNITHHVNHFSFGQIKRSEHLMDGGRRPVAKSNRFPLDATKYYAENVNITIEHYLNVVGYDHSDLREYIFEMVPRVYEFSASSNQYNASNALPAALFTFDISPLVILVVKDNVPLYRFLTSLCAVVGGVFTVIGLVDSGVFHTMKSIKKKAQLGKLH